MLHFVNFARERHNSSSSADEPPEIKELKELQDLEESAESARYFDSISAPVPSSPARFDSLATENVWIATRQYIQMNPVALNLGHR